MNTVAKILIVVNLVLAGAFLASAGNFLGQEDHWKKKHAFDTAELTRQKDEVQATLNKRTEENTRLTTESQNLVGEKARAEERAQQLETQNDLLNQAFKEASQQNTYATSALQAAMSTIQSNRDLIDQLQGERTSMLESTRVAREAKEAAVRNLQEKEIQFENLKDENQALQARVEELQNQLRSAQLTAETAVSRLGGAGAAGVPMDQPAHQGQVLSVDNDNNVAIISLGEEDGVRPGFLYTVSRGSTYVTMLEITNVQARQSAGRSVKTREQGAMQRGDRVTSR